MKRAWLQPFTWAVIVETNFAAILNRLSASPAS